MPIFKVRFYADGDDPVRIERLCLQNTQEARSWAQGEIDQSQRVNRAKVFTGDVFLSEIGYQVRPPLNH